MANPTTMLNELQDKYLSQKSGIYTKISFSITVESVTLRRSTNRSPWISLSVKTGTQINDLYTLECARGNGFHKGSLVTSAQSYSFFSRYATVAGNVSLKSNVHPLFALTLWCSTSLHTNFSEFP